jgi:hypothetical protein
MRTKGVAPDRTQEAPDVTALEREPNSGEDRAVAVAAVAIVGGRVVEPVRGPRARAAGAPSAGAPSVGPSPVSSPPGVMPPIGWG